MISVSLTIATTAITIICLYVLYMVKKVKTAHHPKIQKTNAGWVFTNWGRTQHWKPTDVFFPKSLPEIIEFMEKRKALGVKSMRVFGALHSWSPCCVTSGISINLSQHLNKVLEVDEKKLTIKAEAGILLKDLYVAMREHGMAIPAMPNIEIITLG